ncbi:ankyrin repeat domain-containing protein [Microlunatus soli]|uniref:Uncharacterized protein n=1 Tax=Microlunatus soli TaxID=630515 RepID=A0A1H1R5T9_9ACTN|nr:ankyrin repeat domain-containing protein [Microlunatus soli]SDS30309.1 hypothetical protein SAMN04489812_1495 [Microlunatus soli]
MAATENAHRNDHERAADLRAAVWASDRDAAIDLIEAGADVNDQDDTQQSAFLIAASEGEWEILRATLQHGADLADLDSWRGTALIRAAERGHATVVGDLIRAGIDHSHVNRIGYQALHEAVWLGRDTAAYHDTVRILLAGGAETDRPSGSEGLTPAQMAEQRSSAGVVRIFRALTTSPGTADPDAALLAAARDGDADRAMVALRAGADPEITDTAGRTPLLLAAAADHLEVARLLVGIGADPNAVDDRRDSPWLVTGVTGSTAMVDALLPGRPDFALVNRFGGISVIPASERGHVDYVRRMVDLAVDLDHVNRLGWTALLEAIILGDGGVQHQRIVDVLLGGGADPNRADADGRSPLHHAEQQGYTEIADRLRRAGGR